MRVKVLIPVVLPFIFLLIFNCEKTSNLEKVDETIAKTEVNITAKDIEQIDYIEYVLSDLGETATEDWIRFQEFSNQIEIIKKNDLSFFQDKAILGSFIADLKNEIPEKLNTNSILSRIIVLETMALKIESLHNLNNVSKATKLNYIKDLLEAHTHLIHQINKYLEKESQIISNAF